MKHCRILALFGLGLALAAGPAAAADSELPRPQLKPPDEIAEPDKTAIQPRPRAEPVRGQLKPARWTILASEIDARITKLPVRLGERLDAGALVVAFDCRETRAQRREARARLDGAQAKLTIYEELDSLQSISGLELQETRTEVALATAQLARIDARLAKCRITAPFDSEVVKRQVQPHQFVETGTPMIEIVDNASLQMEAVVDSRWLSWLRRGTGFTMRLDELDARLAGSVARIGGRIDPVSQTVRVIGTLSDPPQRLLAGMSGDVRFVVPGRRGQ